jgi:hypothetical protein
MTFAYCSTNQGFILWRWEDDGILRRESEDLKGKERK